MTDRQKNDRLASKMWREIHLRKLLMFVSRHSSSKIYNFVDIAQQ